MADEKKGYLVDKNGKYVEIEDVTARNAAEEAKKAAGDILWLNEAPTLYTKGRSGQFAFDKHMGFLYAYGGSYAADDTDDGLHHVWYYVADYYFHRNPPTQDNEGETGQLWVDYSARQLYVCTGRDIDVELKKLIYIWEKIGGTAEVTAESITAALGDTPLTKGNITLARHTDGLVYIFVNGAPVGDGLDI